MLQSLPARRCACLILRVRDETVSIPPPAPPMACPFCSSFLSADTRTARQWLAGAHGRSSARGRRCGGGWEDPGGSVCEDQLAVVAAPGAPRGGCATLGAVALYAPLPITSDGFQRQVAENPHWPLSRPSGRCIPFSLDRHFYFIDLFTFSFFPSTGLVSGRISSQTSSTAQHVILATNPIQ